MKAAGIVLRILVDIVVLQYIFAKPNRSALLQKCTWEWRR
jgi:hypothetical protein